MAYVKGDSIVAGDLNIFIGDPGGGADKALVAFGSAASATNKVAALYGVGFGQRGYGQTVESLTLGGTGTNVFSTQWTSLVDAMTILETHQGTTTLAPPNSETAIGQLIEAHESSSPTLDPFDFNSAIALLDTNRLNTDSGLSLNTVASGIVSTRGSTWSSTINCTATATFSTSDEARHFFNSGGSLTVVGAQPGGSAQDLEWARIWGTEVGTYELQGTGSIRSGSGGSAAPAPGNGYYGLTTTPVLHYNGSNIGSGAYGVNDVLITLNYTGATTNGAKGNIITMTVTLQDQHTGIVDIVTAGTTVTFGHRYAGSASVLTGIEQPTWALTNGL